MSMELTQIGPARRYIRDVKRKKNNTQCVMCKKYIVGFREEWLYPTYACSTAKVIQVNVGFHSRYLEGRGVEMSTLHGL